MAIRRWLISGFAVCTMSLPLFAKEGIVKTRDGTSYQGDVRETDDGKVIVKVHNIDMRLDRRDVASIQYIDDVAGDFQKKLAALPPKDVQGRLDLAKQALSQKQYGLATTAAQAALDIDPNSADATDFLTMIRRQQALDHAGKANDPKTPVGQDALVPDQPAVPANPATPIDQKFLGPDDINVIKQMELGANDIGFNAKFLNDVRRKFVLKDNGGTLADFMDLTPAKQARFILDRAPDMRNDVRIITDPASIAMYKQHVQSAVLGGCATSGCHGGSSAGKFVLFTPADTDAATYTNFYLLTKYAKSIDKASVAMIDRTTPQKSLLLQYGMPMDAADYKHPDVPNWKPIFRNAADPRFTAIRDWISKSLQPVAPDYGIKYIVPGGVSPTSKPSK